MSKAIGLIILAVILLTCFLGVMLGLIAMAVATIKYFQEKDR